MRTLSEILADEMNTAYPLDTLDADFDTFDFDCLYVNNYLTMELFAEHHGLYKDEAGKLIELARAVACVNHPEV